MPPKTPAQRAAHWQRVADEAIRLGWTHARGFVFQNWVGTDIDLSATDPECIKKLTWSTT